MVLHRYLSARFFLWALLVGTTISLYAQAEPWSWVYPITFNTDEQTQNNTVPLITTRENIPPFTQLIFSWNALRPTKGYYSFWIQGKDSATGLWSSWHKMIVWGAGVQRSFLSSADAIAQHVHVRFEARAGKKLSGFRIKMRAHNSADLNNIKSIAASCADFTKFKNEDLRPFTAFSSVRVPGVPRRSQFSLKHPDNHKLCSPTSCAMLVESLVLKKCDMNSFVRKVHDSGLDAYGSWPFNTAHAFEQSNGNYWYRVVRYNSFKDVHERLTQGFPVVVSVRGSIKGAPKSYDSGHLLVIVGFNTQAQTVICHDPACKKDNATVRAYPLKSFLLAWESSRRLAYQAELRQ
jgi:peptidase C39-like protein